MTKPLVSIVIPCWNGERTIGEAIESALSQTHAEKEVIVIDDGSTDASLEIIESFGDRVRWEAGPNRGAPAARNRGLALARGSLIQFLDADDLLHPRKVESQADLAAADPKTIFFCDRAVWSETGPERHLVRIQPDQDAFITALENPIQTSTPVYQKATLVQVRGYREDLSICQDYDLHLRLALLGCCYVRVPEALVTTRMQRGSISSNLERVNRQMVLLWRELLKKHPEVWSAARRVRLARALATKGRWFLRHGQEAEARECFTLAVDVDRDGAELAYGMATRLAKSVFGRRVVEQLSQLSRYYRASPRRL